MIFETWVYKTLAKNGNVALPDKAKHIDIETLEKDLKKQVGFKVKIRSAEIKELKTKNQVLIKTYLIAEAKK